uniref:ENTH domain-containing protein n=2 Tax=Percomorphaceae TaxID=1489872 RepID=A0A665UKN1_ECHNA
MTTSALRRQVKNIVHNYSEAEIKVREATSNDPWGPSSSLMSEIADLTFNVVAFAEVMGMVWKRLNDSGKNWRHVYKVILENKLFGRFDKLMLTMSSLILCFSSTLLAFLRFEFSFFLATDYSPHYLPM